MYATSGGPPYPGSTDLSGSYAGVLKPRRQASPTPTPSGTPVTPTPTPSPTASPEDHNSLGVFSVPVPPAGQGVGVFALFSHGQVYLGYVLAEADPTRASFNGVLKGSATSVALENTVTGEMKGRALHTITAPFSSAGVQLRGHAMVDFENNAAPEGILRTESMRVLGFKQTGITSSATPTPTP